MHRLPGTDCLSPYHDQLDATSWHLALGQRLLREQGITERPVDVGQRSEPMTLRVPAVRQRFEGIRKQAAFKFFMQCEHMVAITLGSPHESTARVGLV